MSQDTSAPNAIGKQLVDFCNAGRNLDAINALYANDIVSIEPCTVPPMEQALKGIDEVRKKAVWWYENHEVHSSTAEGPFPHGEDRFAVIFQIDVTPKSGPMSGKRMKMREVAVYTVAGGKIVKEEFFYGMG